MDKGKNEEQKFLRDIERILKGEEVTPTVDSSEDAKSTIEFAKKLTELRADPSPEFRKGLRSRLLRKLTEQEMTARERVGAGWLGGFWNKLIPQSPVWRTAVVTVAIMVVAVGVVWRTGLFTMTSAPGENEEITGGDDRGFMVESSDAQKDWSQEGMIAAGEQEEEETYTAPSLGTEDGVLNIEIEISPSDEITVIVEPLATQHGTDVTLILTCRNNSSEIVTIAPLRLQIVARSLDDELVYTMPVVDGPGELLPSESFQMIYVWNQQDNSGNQIPSGTYLFDIGSIVITTSTASYEIPLPLVEVEILEP